MWQLQGGRSLGSIDSRSIQDIQHDNVCIGQSHYHNTMPVISDIYPQSVTLRVACSSRNMTHPTRAETQFGDVYKVCSTMDVEHDGFWQSDPQTSNGIQDEVSLVRFDLVARRKRQGSSCGG